MPIRYNYDKGEDPHRIRVFRNSGLLFALFPTKFTGEFSPLEREVFYLRQKRCHEIGLRLVSDTKSQYDTNRGNLSPSVPIDLLSFLLSSEIRQPGFHPIGSRFPRRHTAHHPSTQGGIAGPSERRCAPSHRSFWFLPNKRAGFHTHRDLPLTRQRSEDSHFPHHTRS